MTSSGRSVPVHSLAIFWRSPSCKLNEAAWVNLASSLNRPFFRRSPFAPRIAPELGWTRAPSSSASSSSCCCDRRLFLRSALRRGAGSGDEANIGTSALTPFGLKRHGPQRASAAPSCTSATMTKLRTKPGCWHFEQIPSAAAVLSDTRTLRPRLRALLDAAAARARSSLESSVPADRCQRCS